MTNFEKADLELTKLHNYCFTHRDVIDASWCAKVIDEVRQLLPETPQAVNRKLVEALERINHLATVQLNDLSREYYLTNRGDIAAESRKALSAAALPQATPTPRCVGYAGGCDGDLVGERHEEN